MLGITYFGGYLMIGVVTILASLSFLTHHHAKNIWPLLVSVGGTALTVFLLKNFLAVARPEGAFYIEDSFAFPSGHVALAVALYGFLLYIVSRHDPHPLKNPLSIILFSLIILIGASRLYLGVHHLSDVLAGYFIGFLWLVLAISKSSSWLLRGAKRP